jgi:hypothetical protein
MKKETLEQRSVARCCDEMGRAILFLRALRGVVKGETAHGIDFMRLAMFALEDQMIAHMIKVLDGREQAGFWYLYKKHEKACFEFAAQQYIALEDITTIVKKLQHVRDKTHFHLDRRGVRDPRTIWKEADISFDALDRAMTASFAILCFLHEKLRGEQFSMPEYDGSDAAPIAKFAETHLYGA